MIKQTILHVGLHKTGTTSIQATLHAAHNNRLLAAQGFLYPPSWPRNHSIPVYSAFCENPEQYHMNVRKGHSRAQIRHANAKYLHELHADIAAADSPQCLVISGEDVSILPEVRLTALRNYILSISEDIRVIAYVRHPVTWAVSIIQQAIGTGLSYKQAYVNATMRMQQLPNRIQNLLAAFGEDNVEVHTFEEAIASRSGCVEHFLSQIGFNHLEAVRVERANESMSLIAGELISYGNARIPHATQDRSWRHWDRDRIQLRDLGGPKYDIPPNDKRVLIEHASGSLAFLRDAFGINYSDIAVSHIAEPSALNPRSIDEIPSVYSALSDTGRSVVIDYLDSKARFDMDEVLSGKIRLMLATLDEPTSRLDAERRLVARLGINPDLDRSELYRELALFLEINGQLQAARDLMSSASRLRPHARPSFAETQVKPVDGSRKRSRAVRVALRFFAEFKRVARSRPWRLPSGWRHARPPR